MSPSRHGERRKKWVKELQLQQSSVNYGNIRGRRVVSLAFCHEEFELKVVNCS